MMMGAEARPVDVVVSVPQGLVADVEDVRRDNPDFLGRVIQYALARRIIFEELSARPADPR
jgi:hypothetical protein